MTPPDATSARPLALADCDGRCHPTPLFSAAFRYLIGAVSNSATSNSMAKRNSEVQATTNGEAGAVSAAAAAQVARAAGDQRDGSARVPPQKKKRGKVKN